MATEPNQQVIDLVQQAKEKWDAATDAGKRMLIAQDIIDRVRSAQIIPSHSWGTVVQSEGCQVKSVQAAIHAGANCEACALGAVAMSVIGFSNNADFAGAPITNTWRNDINPYVRPNVIYREEHVRLNQQVALNQKLHDLFSASQLQLIEWCYEEGSGNVQISQACAYRDQIRCCIQRGVIPATPTWDPDEKPDYTMHPLFDAQSLWDATIISMSHRNEDDRMIAIMENIIKNNGTFCPVTKPNGQTSPQTATQTAGH